MNSVNQALPHIDAARCTGCGRCVAACDLNLLTLDMQGWKKCSTLHGGDRCTSCGDCVSACPFGVITLRDAATPPPARGHSVAGSEAMADCGIAC